MACFAMLLGVPYREAFKMVHPKRDFLDARGGVVSAERAFKRLKQFGLKPRNIAIDSVRNLKQTAVIWIRWNPGRASMHSYVYEAKTGFFWDPNFVNPISSEGIEEIDLLKEQVIVLDGYKPANNIIQDFSAPRIVPPTLPPINISSYASGWIDYDEQHYDL